MIKVSTRTAAFLLIISGFVLGIAATIAVLVVLAKVVPIPEKQCPGLFEGATPQQLQPLPF